MSINKQFVAFIPVRGGSKSIPLKNIKSFCDKPLVYWTAKAANDCPQIDAVYIATDSKKISDTVKSFGLEKVKVISRSEKTATDTASTESAMLEFAARFSFVNIILIQATSPLLQTEDLSKGIEKYLLGQYDSLLSVVRQKRFIWLEKEGTGVAQNYNPFKRPRRQEWEGYFVENGAFYITKREALISNASRLSGKIGLYEMSEDTYFEIDEPTDWIILETLKAKQCNHINDTKTIKIFLADCDGTLTDGSMYYTANGDFMKKFSTLDGLGFRLLHERGIITGIITGENSEIVRKRAEKLKIDEIYLGIQDKAKIVDVMCQKYNINPNEVAYIGDDLNDLETLKKVGVAICPANAITEIKKVVEYITNRTGGSGAVREAAQYILEKYCCTT